MDNPTMLDLTRYCGPVSYQGAESDCVQNYVFNSILYQTAISGRSFAIDKQFSYQNVLNALGFPNTDHGTVLAVQWAQLQTIGVIADTGHYGAAYIGTQPSATQYADAKTHTVMSMTHINPAEMDLSYLCATIVDLLNKCQPVGIAFQLRQGFLDNTGVNSGALLGGHEVTAFGAQLVLNKDGTYHTVLKCATWGPQFGDHGYFDMDMQASFGTAEAKRDLISADSINDFNGQNWHGDANAINIAELYNGLLKRAPETAAFSNVSAALAGGASLEDAAGWILGSSEFQRLLPAATNAQFVTYLFQNMQGRDPLAGGLAFWTAFLDGGGSRAHLAVEMIHNTQDTAEWAYNLFVGPNQVLRTASDFLYNRAVASIDLSLHMQDAGTDAIGAGLLRSVIAGVTADPNSVQAALQGVPEQLGYMAGHAMAAHHVDIIPVGVPHTIAYAY